MRKGGGGRGPPPPTHGIADLGRVGVEARGVVLVLELRILALSMPNWAADHPPPRNIAFKGYDGDCSESSFSHKHSMPS